MQKHSRSEIEKEIDEAEALVHLAEDDLRAAEDRLADLEKKLSELPADDADAALFYARRDPRQMHLVLELPKRIA